MLTLVIVYFLAKNMFDRQTAYIATILFGFNQGVISQSGFVWQPHILQPFVNLSYLLLFLSYKMKKYWFLLLSIFVFVLSIALNYPPLAIIPVFLFLVVLNLAVQKKNYQYYLGAFIALILSFLILYFPLIFYFLKIQSFPPQISQKVIDIFRQSPYEIVQNFITRIGIFFKLFLCQF